MFSLEEQYGDLFKETKEDDCLVHCVARDFKMGKGIAKNFRDKFQRVEELKQQNKRVGQCASLKHNQRYIFYLITKETSSYSKPTMITLENALQDLKKQLLLLNITTLCMPKIGCGLDELNWEKVKKLLIETFKDTAIKIKVFYIQK